MERPSRKERWDKERKRKLGGQSIWDTIRQDQFTRFLEMDPEQLAQQSGQYEIASAQDACHVRLQEAINSGDEHAIAAWREVSNQLAEWRKEYYRRSQQPSRFSSWAAQSYASIPQYNPRARF